MCGELLLFFFCFDYPSRAETQGKGLGPYFVRGFFLLLLLRTDVILILDFEASFGEFAEDWKDEVDPLRILTTLQTDCRGSCTQK